jgi:hypothetical protein
MPMPAPAAATMDDAMYRDRFHSHGLYRRSAMLHDKVQCHCHPPVIGKR